MSQTIQELDSVFNEVEDALLATPKKKIKNDEDSDLRTQVLSRIRSLRTKWNKIKNQGKF